MIKRLRIRVTFFAIAAFAVVIILMSILVNAVNYSTVTTQADETLSAIWNFENDYIGGPSGSMIQPLIPIFMEMSNPEAEYITRFFIVEYDDNGNILQVYTDNIAASREETQAVADAVLSKRANSGYYHEYRYLKGKGRAGNIAVFLNVMRDQQQLKSVRIITMIVAGSSLLIVSVLVCFFSGAAIRPIANNIKQQKQFITDASHELKTPITSIMTSLDVIALEGGEDEWTTNIRNQSQRMSKLVGELVALSRLDETKTLGTKEEFSLDDLAWEILEVYQSRAKAGGRQIETQIEEGLRWTGDKAAIGQLLSVLLDNAIKYAKGDGNITFSVYRKHNKVRMELSNPTYYEEKIDVNRLFDRFYRPDNARNSKDGGSGIGLAIAKAVVEAHGGKIIAECPDGKKMTMRVIL